MESKEFENKIKEYVVSVLETADKNDPETILAVAELIKSTKVLHHFN
ncbi:hypothetical protein [Streptococcus anginosus]|jgi:hypothetical protein|nr:hypothetical protein [Streptococcus anginosus]MCW1057160.1 hypothetical protein [Streptococcus anginosus]MED5861312.1 hypothetical protein [Streptococcus anginosus]MED5961358.1 hypothetical protein [Streptococcus anginosus]WEB13924.1 hypothetical protein PUW49_02585 [Streptococcus anginosus]